MTKPEGRSGAPPSAMVEKLNKLFDEWENGTPEQVALLTQLAIAAMFDNLPRAEMIHAICGYPCRKCIGRPSDGEIRCGGYWDAEARFDAAISAARAAVLGSAKGDA